MGNVGEGGKGDGFSVDAGGEEGGRERWEFGGRDTFFNDKIPRVDHLG